MVFVDERVNPLGIKGLGEVATSGLQPPWPTPFFTPLANGCPICESLLTSCWKGCEENHSVFGKAARRGWIYVGWPDVFYCVIF